MMLDIETYTFNKQVNIKPKRFARQNLEDVMR